MPSIRDALVHQARDERLSLYRSPTFCRRSKLDNELCIEKPDEFGWLNAFDPRRGARVGNISSTSPNNKPNAELRRISAVRQSTGSPVTNRKSMASKEEASTEQTATENLLAKKQKQRPFSLVVDNNVSLALPQVSANVNHRSCCNLRNEAAEPSGSSSVNNRSRLATGMREMENLSRSCGDLRTNPADSHRISILPELRRISASQLSLYSGQISTPTDSRTGSRVSLISEGVDSYEGLYEKAYRATYVLNTPDPPPVIEGKVPRDRMVRDWLAQNNPEDTRPARVSDTAAL